MAIHDRYFPGSTLSRYLPPGERAWGGVIYQSGRPVLDTELVLNQDIGDNVRSLLLQKTAPSGWVTGQARKQGLSDYSFDVPADPTFTADAFWMTKQVAVVAGNPVVVEYSGTDTAGTNLVELDAAPTLGGAPPDIKRTDFVFLEVWLAPIENSPRASGTAVVQAALPAPADFLTLAGNALTAVAGAPAVDQYTVGADELTTAANIASAINNVANSFSGTMSASAGGTDTVTIKAAVSGVAGNAITLVTSDALGVAVSGPTLAGGVDKGNKPTQDTIYRHGNVLSSSTVALADDLADPTIDAETTQRVQVQYRLRVTGQTIAVNYKTQCDGFTNTGILARGAVAAPVATYPFVKADLTSVSGNSSAVTYDVEDNGLWIAGDGTLAAATALGTVDGYVYAIPACFVFRRNDAYLAGAGAGWDPLNNTNGALPSTHALFANPAVGAIAVGLSDRPDRAFSDAINVNDVLDLRKHVSLAGRDMAAELQYQMESLLDGQLATWAIDTADKQVLGSGSGDVSTQFLVCNQVGRDTAHGGNSPISGSTTRGPTIRNFDHVARRFGDQPVVERVVLALSPDADAATYPGKYNTQATPGWNGWGEDDVLNIDLTELNASTIGDWDPAGATYVGPGPGHNASVMDFAPPGTLISDILGIWHDDGHFTTAVNQTVQLKTATGLGTGHVAMTLDANALVVNGGDSGNPNHPMVGTAADTGSQRRIFVEVELTYPIGSGITDTPDLEVIPDTTPWPNGPMLENNTTQRPVDMEDRLDPRFREGFREVSLEYITNDGSGVGSGTPVTDSIVSRNTTDLHFLRRIFGSGAHLTGVTDSVAAQVHDIDSSQTEYGSSSRKVVLDTTGGVPAKLPLSGTGQTLCAVTYFPQDPIPNYGAAGGGYQVGVYYRSNAPQTTGVMSGALTTMPDPLTVEPLVMSRALWTGQVGMGSVDLPFPYSAPLDQIAVNDNGTATFPGEWYFAATASISIDDFNAETGLLNLHSFVPVDGTTAFTFDTTGKDLEFRAFYEAADTTAYRPTMFSQELSGVVRHKVCTPFLARITADSVLYRKNEVVLVVLSRWAQLDADNTVRFADTDNRGAAAIYRTRNHLIIVE